MTFAAKQRLVGIFLSGMALWPLLHLGLVQRYDLSRWKLAGWGMYTEPSLQDVGMEVFGRREPGAAAEQWTTGDASLRTLAAEFLYDYRWLRRLTEPRDLAAAVLATRPTWSEVDIDVFRPFVAPHSGYVEQDHVRYRYRASPDGPQLISLATDLP